jgi:hypothetical protein
MADDPVDDLRLFDKRDDSHPAATRRTDERIDSIDLADHIGPAFGWHKQRLFFNDRGRRERRVSLAYLPSVGIRVKSIVVDQTTLYNTKQSGDSKLV